MSDSNVTIKIYSIDNTCKRICDNNKLGLFLAQTWANYFDKYIPEDTATLKSNYTTEPFTVTYNSPYAHYQWEGVSRFTGNPLNYSMEKNPLATSHWEQPAYEAFKDEVARQVEHYIRRM